MTKKLLIVLVASATFFAGGDIALAARGGNGGDGKAGPTGSIELTEPGVQVVAAVGAADAAYGDTVHFDTEVTNASTKAQVYVTIVCMQDADVVFQVSGDRDDGFELTDRAGLVWDGGPADCEAWLIHRVKKGRGYEITYLDMDPFTVG